MVLEGGAIDVNGLGCLLTTKECLLSKIQERNLGYKKRDMENIFKTYLGVKKIIWLNKGIEGDDTHGHIAGDKVLIFVSNNSWLLSLEQAPFCSIFLHHSQRAVY